MSDSNLFSVCNRNIIINAVVDAEWQKDKLEDDLLEIPEQLDIQAGDDADIDNAEDAAKKEEEKWTDLALEAFDPPAPQSNT